MSCCPNIVCIELLLSNCDETVQLPIIATDSGPVRVLYEFNHTTIEDDIVITQGQAITVPNHFNERYNHILKFLLLDGTLLGDTCYLVKTSPLTDLSQMT